MGENEIIKSDNKYNNCTLTTNENEFFQLLYKIWNERHRYDINKIMEKINEEM